LAPNNSLERTPRIAVLWLTLVCLIGAAAHSPSVPSPPRVAAGREYKDVAEERYELSIATIPEHVFKEEDGTSGKWLSEGWVFHVIVRERKDREATAKSATVELYSGWDLLKTVRFSEAALAALHGVSFTATIGFVALIGIEIKTSILLVDLTNQMRAQGVPVGEAIRKAGEIRFLPIVLTSMTAIGGLLPIAVQGSAMYAPLAWVIIGGLVSSTLLARIVTPVMYQLITPEV